MAKQGPHILKAGMSGIGEEGEHALSRSTTNNNYTTKLLLSIMFYTPYLI